MLVQLTSGQGRVTYTSFHNESQSHDDVKNAIKFVVFSL